MVGKKLEEAFLEYCKSYIAVAWSEGNFWGVGKEGNLVGLGGMGSPTQKGVRGPSKENCLKYIVKMVHFKDFLR